MIETSGHDEPDLTPAEKAEADALSADLDAYLAGQDVQVASQYGRWHGYGWAT